MGITDYSIYDGIKDPFSDMESIPDTIKGAKSMQPDGSLGEARAITLLSERSSKITPNDLLLYPQIRASSNSHQRRFALQQMVINTESLKGHHVENKRHECSFPNPTSFFFY